MSTLTKVFALLVSALSIFLCGVVITYISNTQNWKQAYDNQVTKTKAAQIEAMAAQQMLTDARARSQRVVNELRNTIAAINKYNNDLSIALAAAQQNNANSTSQAQTAVQTMAALRETIQNMYDAQLALQKSLDADRTKMITAQTEMIDLTRRLNILQADNNQLKSKLKQQIEKVYALEDENASLRQKASQVALKSNKFEATEQVTQLEAGAAAVPIRGEIVEVDGDLAAISVGSSSGVRKDMKMIISRGTKFLGQMRIIHVEPSQSVGRMDNVQGTIVAGDTVLTGFK